MAIAPLTEPAAPSAYLGTLASFVPTMILRQANAGAGAATQASLERGEAAVLFVDVAGFTALTETLAQRGAAGAEDLTQLLNRYFGQLIDAILDHGGDIVKFAGDALVALWPVGDGIDLADQALRVVDCALGMQARLNDYEVAEGFRLRVKLAIGAGEVLAERLGGVYDRWELLIAGDALRQIGVGNDHARPGDVIISREARALIADRVQGEEVPDGARRVTRLLGKPPTGRPPRPPLPRPHAAAALRAFIPAAVRTRLDAEQVDWLGELRRVSVLFVNLPDFNVATPLDRAQEAMRAVQMALYRFEGSINKMSVDDKGASLIAVFGLPPLSHGDDPERAVRAAVASHAALAELGFRAWIGVTTGTAFCGAVGNARRREYTIMGDVVNLSARLMQAAGGGKSGVAVPGGILCCGATWSAAVARLAFETLVPIKVKGKAAPIEVHRPLPQAKPLPAAASGLRRIRIVGRESERNAIAALLDRLNHDRQAQRLVLLGDGGIGKSRLLQEAMGLAGERGMLALVGGGDPIETTTPYRAWRQVFEKLLAEDASGEDSARRATILANLPADPLVLRDAPLLEAVLPHGWPDNDFTRGLSGKARADRTRNLLAAILRATAGEVMLLVLIEDAQWLDSASLALLRDLMRADAMLAVIASARPFEEAPPAEWLEILDTPGMQSLTLGPLGPAALAELCRRRLAVQRLPEALIAFVAERSEGNPMFAEELVFTLRDNGTIVLEGDEARIAAGREDPAGWQLPTTVEGLIAARIDRLAPAEQMTMKVASVIGRVFAQDALAGIHPSEEAQAELQRHCEALARLEMTPPVKGRSLLGPPSAGTAAWKFKSNLLKDVAYNRMLFSQRRELHRKLAEWLEGVADPEQPAMAPLLAFHWRKAAEDRLPEPAAAMKAAGYYARAANHALKLHALKEAIGFWQEGLALLRQLPAGTERDRQELRLLLELGPAQVAAGSFSAPDVEASFDRARLLCEQVGRHAQLFRALRGLWQVRVGQADYPRARALADELLGLAIKVGDPALSLEAHRAIGTTAFWTADLAGARHHLERAAALYEPARHRALVQLYGQDPCVAARGILAWALAHRGEAAAAREQAAQAAIWAEELAHPFSLAYAHGASMWTGYFLGDTQLAAAAGQRCADLSLERGFPYLVAAGRVVHGWATGDATEVEGAVRAWRQIGGGIGLPIFLLVQSDIQLAQGRHAEARQSLNDPILLDRHQIEAWLTVLFHRLRGEALAAAGETPAARDAFALALSTAERQGAALHLASLARRIAALGGG